MSAVNLHKPPSAPGQMFRGEKKIYFKECFANEKSKYFCLDQKKFPLYFHATAIPKVKDCNYAWVPQVDPRRQPHGAPQDGRGQSCPWHQDPQVWVWHAPS